MRIPELKLTVVQADGQNIEPVTVDEFRFGPGETYDVIVEPKNDVFLVYKKADFCRTQKIIFFRLGIRVYKNQP